MIPAEAVEAAAKAYYSTVPDAWGNADEETRRTELSDFRAMLEAAAPYMLAVAWEEGRLVGRAEEQSGFDTEMNPYGDPYMRDTEGEK